MEVPGTNVSDSTSEIAKESDYDTHTSDTLNCKKVLLNIKQKLLRKFPVPNQKRKTESNIITSIQPRIDSKFQIINKMDSEQKKLYHKALTQFFITVAIEKELQDENNLTLANEIEKVLTDIGANKFRAIVSDTTSAMTLAKEYILAKYLAILPIRCGLKSSVCSCWSSAYNCVQSVLNLEVCIKQILEDDNLALTVDLKNLVQNRQFWANAEIFAKILLPTKNAVKMVESKSTTADKEFDIKIYLLAYFLYPKYQGKDMKNLVFHQIMYTRTSLGPWTSTNWAKIGKIQYDLYERCPGSLYTALEVWKKIGKGEVASANILVVQIKKYDAHEPLYNFSFVEEIESLQIWWNGCKLENHYLQKLALHLLAIIPYSASCKHIFSVLSWIIQKAEKVSNIAKLHTYYMTNTQNELNYFTHNILESEFEQIIENYLNSIEYNDDMFNNNIEESDRDYVSDKNDLEKIIQIDCENLDANEIIDFDIFTEKHTNETNYNNNIEAEKEPDYDINEVINTAITNTK
ncbi:hypothetical protein C2G38_2228425 [Gigaspora rosea]|uniref:HAT C-terminal dimerisation domain-containing protein n=1 Tax=Gigaspora rosea TaxID=44941 RepID=A0A397U0A8_9GLOM|nr:hypothetical protein C2G38_2228425 [Gigaspora rosea]